jgi:hypothetical protein
MPENAARAGDPIHDPLHQNCGTSQAAQPDDLKQLAAERQQTSYNLGGCEKARSG